MRTIPTLIVLVATLVACGADEELVLAESTEAQAARTIADPQANEAALDVASAMAVVFEEQAAVDFAELGIVGDEQLASIGASVAVGCIDAAVTQGELVLVYAGCTALEGTVRLSASRGSPTVLVMEDDFTWKGTDIDGTLAVDAQLRDRELTVSGDVTYGDTQLALALEVMVDGGVALWGSMEVLTAVDGQELSLAVTLGSEAVPVRFERGCTCPVQGTVAGGAAVMLDQVTLDLDDLILPGDGQDDYPPLDVAITPIQAEAGVTTDFEPTCGDPLVDASADDFTLAMDKADLEAAVDAACAAGEIDASDCTFLGFAFNQMPETLEVQVPASMMAESAEVALQAAADTLCR